MNLFGTIVCLFRGHLPLRKDPELVKRVGPVLLPVMICPRCDREVG